MENLEAYRLERDVLKEKRGAGTFEEEAERLEAKAAIEEVYAERDRDYSYHMAEMANLEQQKAESMLDKSHFTEELRQKVLANITQTQEDEEETLEQIRKIHEGACSWKGLSTICDTVGGITGLQQKADKEALLIQSEWREAAALDRQEKLQSMIAEMLVGKAEKFNETASDLLRVADLWEAHADRQWEMALAMNETSQEMEEEASEKEHEVSEMISDINELQIEAHKYLRAAQMDHVAAYWFAIAAIVTGFSALFFFVITAASRALVFFEQASYIDPARNEDTATWYNATYCVLHGFVFLVTVGMTGDYFFHMSQYPVGQRAIILVWFSFLASVFHTFLLQAVPRFLVECRAQVPSITDFVFHLICKFLVFFFVFMIEVLLVWLSLGRTLFSPPIVNAVSAIPFCLMVVVLALVHAVYFDKQTQQPGNESVTVWRCDDQSTILSNAGASYQTSFATSECTPLRKEEILSHGTVIDLHGEDLTRSSLSSESRTSWREYFVALRKELYQIVLPFEILVVACMVTVLRSCLMTVWNSQATVFQCAVLVCASVLVLMGAILVNDLTCCDECQDSRTTVRRREKITKMLGKRPDALELVEV